VTREAKRKALLETCWRSLLVSRMVWMFAFAVLTPFCLCGIQTVIACPLDMEMRAKRAMEVACIYDQTEGAKNRLIVVAQD
jgi:hypothetical protein